VTELLWLHTATHLRFYKRSRLVLGFALLVGGLWAAQLIPFFFLSSTGSRFELLKGISEQCRTLGWFLAAGLGLFTVSSHLRSRSVELLMTRPGRPHVWLASIFVASFGVAFGIQLLAALVTVGLSIAWDIPYQAGFAFLSVKSLFETMIVISFLTMLGTALHPVIAALVAIIVNDQTLYGLNYMFQGLASADLGGAWLDWVASLLRAVYLALPMLDPFGEQTASVAATLRVSRGDWTYLAAIAAYSLTVTFIFFVLSDEVLRRRSIKATA
jgi:hypothetical protein